MAISSNGLAGLKPGVCTSSTRPSGPYEGQMIYTTDLDTLELWNGSAWKVISYGSVPLCVLENASFSLADGVNTQVPYTSEVTDTYNWHSNSTNTTRITPTIAGVYLATVMLNNVSSGTRALHGVYKNGAATTVPVFMDTPATIDDFAVAGYVTANGTTDYFEHTALQTSGATKTNLKCQFGMKWICEA